VLIVLADIARCAGSARQLDLRNRRRHALPLSRAPLACNAEIPPSARIPR
jgi:hypothetical protein